jgi:8-oxo-dGTP diphosphatase
MVESLSTIGAGAIHAQVYDAATGIRPAIDLRVVLFSVSDGELLVALRDDGPDRSALPRGLPGPEAGLDGEARRIVDSSDSGAHVYLEQLYTLSVDAGPGWTIIVSYLALAAAASATAADGSWRPIAALPPLGDADRMVLDYALVRLRAKIGYTTIAFHLLPPTFTLRELQDAYEAILGHALDKRNFRRRLTAANVLEPTADKRRDGSHRPAVVYRFRADHDPATYLTPPGAPAPADSRLAPSEHG